MNGTNAACFTVGFYNLENLFDTRDNPRLLDDDFTPRGKRKWTEQRYRNKLGKLGRTISRLAHDSDLDFPVLLGVAELENRQVLEDLLGTRWLKDSGLRFIHYDSPDERGIDTALLYHPDFFEPAEHRPVPLILHETDGRRDFTRDIVYVRGRLNGEEVNVLVNHWPSRRDGDDTTRSKRVAAAGVVLDLVSAADSEGGDPNFIIMGDFNDGPASESIRLLTESAPLYNPMEGLQTPERGSANYQRDWMLFDQILLSESFLKHAPGTHSFEKADIFDRKFLQEWAAPFRGLPFRTFVGRKYLGGYSDHFPVYVQLKFHPRR